MQKIPYNSEFNKSDSWWHENGDCLMMTTAPLIFSYQQPLLLPSKVICCYCQCYQYYCYSADTSLISAPLLSNNSLYHILCLFFSYPIMYASCKLYGFCISLCKLLIQLLHVWYSTSCSDKINFYCFNFLFASDCRVPEAVRSTC